MLLERDDQLGALRACLDAASAGSGRFVLVGGEAGAGKTSLVRAVIDQAPRSIETCVGACDPLTTPRPLSPLVDHAAAAGPLAGLDVTGGDPTAVFQDVLARLQASGAVVLVIEDLHWADQATLDFVVFLARRIGATSTMAIATYRDDEIGPDHPARAVLGHLSSLLSTVRVSVPPLSLDAVTALAADHDVDPAELHLATAGNAFFVTEVLASGSSLPDSVQDAVLARVAALSDAERRAVQAVSVAPRSLDVETATSVAGGDRDDVDGAVAAGVLIEQHDRLCFRHELARTAVELSIPPARRQALHAAMLTTLTDRGDPDRALIAHHAIRAGSADLIVEHAPIAAADARSRSAIREATSFARAALEHDDRLDPAVAASLRVDLAGDLADLDRADESIAVAQAAGDYYRSVDDAAGEARALLRAGVAMGRIGRADESTDAFAEAVARLEPLGLSDGLARALNQVASGAMLARQAEPGLIAARRAQEIADAAGTADTQRAIRHVVACLELIGGDPQRGLDLLHDSVAEYADDDYRLGIALVNLGSGAGEIRRYDVANDALQRGEHHCAAHDLDDSANYVRAWLARVEFEQGRWDTAVEYAEHVDRTVVNRAGYALLTALGALGRVRVRRGDPAGRTLLEAAAASSSGHNLQYLWPVACGIAEAHWLRGEHDAMVRVLTPWYDDALRTDSVWARGELGFWMWRAGAIDTAPSRAAEPFARQIDGDWRGAADAWRSIGCPYEVGLALADGDVDARLDAVAIFDDLGAKPMADRLRDELRGLGVERIPRGPASATREHPFGLTGRQAEVFELMAEGLSNGEIAERLYVSKKTVEHHVSAVFTKLGVTTRAQAIAAARG